MRITSSSLSWDGNLNSGTVSWEFVGDSSGNVWSHQIAVVEGTAYYPEGSNGLEHYNHSVREVYDLNGDSGSLEITLPAAFDGDDLHIVLLHEWVMVVGEPEPSPESPKLPGFLSIGALGALGAAAIRRR